MIQEIFEQPDIIKSILKKHLRGKQIVFSELKNYLKIIKDSKRIIILGCGSSYFAGMLGNYVFEELSNINCEVEFADEFDSRKAVVENKTIIIALSQSGHTTDVLQSVKILKSRVKLVIGITNNDKSKLAQLSDVHIDCMAGEEKGIAATKSFTAQVLILLLLALYFSEKRGEITKIKYLSYINAFKVLPDKVKILLEEEKKIIKISRKIYYLKNLIILGKKFNYPIALEGGQKFKETTYIQTEGYTSEEFIHGPCALLDDKHYVIHIAPRDSVWENNIDVLRRIKQMGANEIVISDVKKFPMPIENQIKLPFIKEIFYPLLAVIPLQLFAYHIALLKGIDIDKPRNITKFIIK